MGGHRVNCTLIEDKHTNLCLINAYMPCRGTHTHDTYDEITDKIKEITAKYRGSHHIIITGDMNASLSREPANSKDKKFRNFCKENAIIMPEVHEKGDTFQHHNGSSSAQLDYFLCGKETEHLILNIVIYDRYDAINTSDHKPATCTILTRDRQQIKSEDKPINSKPNWEKCDIQKYKEELSRNLQTEQNNMQTEFSITQSIRKFYSSVKSAENNSIPKKRKRKNKRCKQKWTEELKTAVKLSKQAHREWKRAGSPRNSDSPIFIQRKVAKKHLRSIQRQQEAKQRTKLYEDITCANGQDQKTFYKLVNAQRNSNTSNTKEIIVDNVEYLTDENIIQGWSIYFEKLSQPKEDPRFIEEHKIQVMDDIQIIEGICLKNKKQLDPVSEEDVKKVIQQLKNGKAADYAGLTSEHLKHAADEVAPSITNIINAIFTKAEIPEELKTGILTPVLKKGKEKTIPTNYRGITVTPLRSCYDSGRF